MSEITSWFQGRLPDGWFEEAADIQVDREEILVVGRLGAPAEAPPSGSSESSEDAAAAARAAASGRIGRFRDDTRGQRIQIAREAEGRFGRKVAWGATCGEVTEVFTSLAVPVMTRLRQPERVVLDTLVDAGVARSRSEALGWSVKLVGRHEADWIASLREALVGVREAREAGPAA